MTGQGGEPAITGEVLGPLTAASRQAVAAAAELCRTSRDVCESSRQLLQQAAAARRACRERRADGRPG
jgi:hypothetical protein